MFKTSCECPSTSQKLASKLEAVKQMPALWFLKRKKKKGREQRWVSGCLIVVFNVGSNEEVGNVLSTHAQKRLPRSPQLSPAISRFEHTAQPWLCSGHVHKPLLNFPWEGVPFSHLQLVWPDHPASGWLVEPEDLSQTRKGTGCGDVF